MFVPLAARFSPLTTNEAIEKGSAAFYRRMSGAGVGTFLAMNDRMARLRQIQVSGGIQKSVSAAGVAIIHRYSRSPGTPFRATNS